jgi:hypothetical protein
MLGTERRHNMPSQPCAMINPPLCYDQWPLAFAAPGSPSSRQALRRSSQDLRPKASVAAALVTTAV